MARVSKFNPPVGFSLFQALDPRIYIFRPSSKNPMALLMPRLKLGFIGFTRFRFFSSQKKNRKVTPITMLSSMFLMTLSLCGQILPIQNTQWGILALLTQCLLVGKNGL